jgi:hypothetical protein
MHREIGAISSFSWFWPALGILLILLVIGFIIYRFTRRGQESETSTLSEDEEMAEIYCPDLLSEVIQLRAEVKKLKRKT